MRDRFERAVVWVNTGNHVDIILAVMVTPMFAIIGAAMFWRG